jgi:hypothetical protein
MSPINFDALANERPDLRRTLNRLAKWLSKNRDPLLVPATLARQIEDVDPFELASALMLLSQAGYLRKRYKVLTPSGVYAEGDFGEVAEIPDRLRDRFNNYFDTAETDVLPVFLREGKV